MPDKHRKIFNNPISIPMSSIGRLSIGHNNKNQQFIWQKYHTKVANLVVVVVVKVSQNQTKQVCKGPVGKG